MRAIARYIRAHHLALLALFVALGGTSMAATNLINGKHIKPHTIPKNRLTNAAITSLHGAKGAQGTPGPQGPPGPGGNQGPRGATGPQGPSSWDSLIGSPCTTEQGTGHTEVFYASQGGSTGGDLNKYGSGIWASVPVCLTPDDLEPNDSQAAATDATSFYNTSDVIASLYPSTDNDWYKLTNIDLSGRSIVLSQTGRNETSAEPKTFIDVYEDSTKVATRATFYNVPASTGKHNWFVRVYGTKADFYELNLNGNPVSGAPARPAGLLPALGRVHS